MLKKKERKKERSKRKNTFLIQSFCVKIEKKKEMENQDTERILKSEIRVSEVKTMCFLKWN